MTCPYTSVANPVCHQGHCEIMFFQFPGFFHSFPYFGPFSPLCPDFSPIFFTSSRYFAFFFASMGPLSTLPLCLYVRLECLYQNLTELYFQNFPLMTIFLDIIITMFSTSRKIAHFLWMYSIDVVTIHGTINFTYFQILKYDRQ